MAAASPTPETLNPPMNVNDSSSSPTPSAPEQTPKPTDKRKREEEEGDQPDPDRNEQNPHWKTSLCSYFRRYNGSCSHGEKCRYAHGESELRPRPDNSWDPTSERAKKLARKSTEEGNGKNNDGGDEVRETDDDAMMTEAISIEADSDDGSNGGLAKCIRNLRMKWSSDNFRCFLKDEGIAFKSAKKKKGMNVGFVNFENSEQVRSAIKALEGKPVGNKILKIADVVPRSFEKTNRVVLPASQNTEQSGKPAGIGDSSNVPESSNSCDADDPAPDSSAPGSLDVKSRSVRDAVAPLAHLSYADQLEHKKSSLKQMLKKLTKNARKACPNDVTLPEWILKAREIGGLPCQLEGIIESPLVNGYRNKCEFSVGYSLQGRPTVGFLLGNFREGVTAVEEPTDCPNVSRVACRYAAIFQEFLQTSRLPIWNRMNNTGFWRQLTVREGRRPSKTAVAENFISEVLLMVQVCMAGFDEGQVKEELESMAQAFAKGAAPDSTPLPLSALLVQDHQGISNAAPADTPLRSISIPRDGSDCRLQANNDGEEVRFRDYMSNLHFCISPTAFFQVNTLAAEKLYALAGDWAGLGPDTLLFDICCGTGTIGLTLAHRVGMVVGIEMNASAVSDAHRNAEINGIKNCRFVCAKAEDVIGSLLREYLTISKAEVANASEKTSQEHETSEAKVNFEDSTAEPEKCSALEHGIVENDPASSETIEELKTSEEKVKLIEELKTSEEKVKTIEELKTSEEKVNSKDSVEPEKCPALEHENGENASISEGNGPLLKACSLKDGSSSVRHFKNVVAIVDPPRVGLHPTVTKVLRTHAHLRRLVYISCNPESLVANAIELCTPSAEKTEKGSNKDNRGWRNMSAAGLARHRVKSMPHSEPFKPVKAMAVDLFPHTPHCELVMLLER